MWMYFNIIAVKEKYTKIIFNGDNRATDKITHEVAWYFVRNYIAQHNYSATLHKENIPDSMAFLPFPILEKIYLLSRFLELMLYDIGKNYKDKSVKAYNDNLKDIRNIIFHTLPGAFIKDYSKLLISFLLTEREPSSSMKELFNRELYWR